MMNIRFLVSLLLLLTLPGFGYSANKLEPVDHKPSGRRENPAIFIKKDVAWEKTPHGYDVGQGEVVALDDVGHFLQVHVQFFKNKDGTVDMDLKSGYFLQAGSWKRTGPSTLETHSKTVDSYKYVKRGNGPPDGDLKQTWTLAGPPISLSQKLIRDQDTFEKTPQLRNEEPILGWWTELVANSKL